MNGEVYVVRAGQNRERTELVGKGGEKRKVIFMKRLRLELGWAAHRNRDSLLKKLRMNHGDVKRHPVKCLSLKLSWVKMQPSE